MALPDAPHVVQSAVSRRLSGTRRAELAADGVWDGFAQLAFDYGCAHWSYVAAPTCASDRILGEALRVTAYPRAHVEACERQGLFRAVPSLSYAFRRSAATTYRVVRDSAPRSPALAAFSRLNRQHGVSRGILIPLTDVVGVRAALGLAFAGSDRELETFWDDHSQGILDRGRALHGSVQGRHLASFATGLLPALSPRKRSVLRVLAHGCTTTEAADALHIGVSTIDKHIADLKRLLRAGTTAHLTALAVQYGLLEEP